MYAFFIQDLWNQTKLGSRLALATWAQARGDVGPRKAPSWGGDLLHWERTVRCVWTQGPSSLTGTSMRRHPKTSEMYFLMSTTFCRGNHGTAGPFHSGIGSPWLEEKEDRRPVAWWSESDLKGYLGQRLAHYGLQALSGLVRPLTTV